MSSSKESAVMAACMLFSSGATIVYKLMLACFWTSEPILVAAASFTSKDADWLSRIWTS